MKNKKYRKETDSMGNINVPSDSFYGAQTQRAINNFPISNIVFDKHFIYAVVLIKKMLLLMHQILF